MNKAIVSTRNIGVVLAKRKRLDRLTTKDIDASIKIKKPEEEPMKSPLISTHNIADVTAAKEKRERDAIMAERKAFREAEAKKKAEEPKEEPKLVEPSKELKIELDEAQKKLAVAERMKKVRAAKKKKETTIKKK